MKNRLIDIHELGKIIGQSPKTIRNRLHEGTFPIKPVKQGGRRNYWFLDEVYAYLEGLRKAS